jgi:hypothetical protein
LGFFGRCSRCKECVNITDRKRRKGEKEEEVEEEEEEEEEEDFNEEIVKGSMERKAMEGVVVVAKEEEADGSLTQLTAGSRSREAQRRNHTRREAEPGARKKWCPLSLLADLSQPS